MRDAGLMDGWTAVAPLEATLRAEYERALLPFAERAAAAYRARSRVLTAAPRAAVDLDEILDTAAMAQGADRATRKTREKLVAAISEAVLSGDDKGRRAARPVLMRMIERQAGVQAARIVSGARLQVAAVMAEALANGLSVADTAAAIRDRVVQFSRAEATMLARTDLISLSNGGALASAQAISDPEARPTLKVWLAASDERVRPAHEDANGQEVPFDQPFDVDGEPLMYPGDPAGSDGNVINCRCTVTFGYADEIEEAA